MGPLIYIFCISESGLNFVHIVFVSVHRCRGLSEKCSCQVKILCMAQLVKYVFTKHTGTIKKPIKNQRADFESIEPSGTQDEISWMR